MDLENYRQKKENEKIIFRQDRQMCLGCWQPQFNCYCHAIEKFDPKMEFVILIHPVESRRRIATGRMSYLSLEGSHILRGNQFANRPRLKALLAEPGYRNIILSPGETATNLTDMSDSEVCEQFSPNEKLRIFVLDGTWANVGKMYRGTPELHDLQKYFFIPDRPSNIRVRKQPSAKCYCTLEAIHHMIELVGPSQGFATTSRLHDKLLKPFEWMVERQIERIKANRNWRSNFRDL